jgi:alcohol dehydrogenase
MPVKIIFGLNTAEQLGVEIKKLNGRKVLVVTDPTLRKMETMDVIVKSLESVSLEFEVFDKIKAEPPIECIEDLVGYIKQVGCDVVVGVGGGSVLDSAKVASVLVNNPGDPEDYYYGGKKTFENAGISCITVPTTAGTCAEITGASVVTDRKGIKGAFAHPFLYPKLAIVDPMMTVSMPPKLTASTGIDALSHAIDTILGRGDNPITRALALQSIRLISENLRVAVYQGDNIAARYNMSLAALMEPHGVAGVSDSHAVAEIVGSLHKIPHGVACCCALPSSMEYNIMVSPNKLKLIAEAMGEDVDNLSLREAAYKGINAVRQLIKDVDLPVAYKDIGMKEEDLEKVAELLVTSPRIADIRPNLVRKLTRENALWLIKRAWEG